MLFRGIGLETLFCVGTGEYTGGLACTTHGQSEFSVKTAELPLRASIVAGSPLLKSLRPGETLRLLLDAI
jgi:hypothetical protein